MIDYIYQTRTVIISLEWIICWDSIFIVFQTGINPYLFRIIEVFLCTILNSNFLWNQKLLYNKQYISNDSYLV